MTKQEFDKIPCDYLRGKLSGIPDCCIAFFVEVWQPLVMSGMVNESPQIFWWKNQYVPLIASWGYVPCPICKIQGNKINVIHHEPKPRKKRVKPIELMGENI